MTKYRHTKPEFDTSRVKPDPPKTCPVSGKRMYTSERAANSTAAHLMTSKDSAPAQLRTYKCLYCGAWHLTSKEA
jgi:hypothetical protein